ncbi:cupredoxin domain-containing protein [Natrialbaceae archaeon AArc-T1-2]|uniref:cupredoxin domain-containing protein n=1 Tax=Natrialbaceae archaeon AArc-T1-2 TaxID=3053904 RepID=UPI00255A91FE|nr:plastocyanin/azurin family copper-binding protein [Natrialbaceae archaeon AArc-T1-2]WIV67836.1 plastocyanin/azurin family copper-binding protein [Natrialbaceae archaeon AArc-T1-2]
MYRRRVLAAGVALTTAGCLGSSDATDDEPWEDVHEIELDGLSSNWIGVSPDHIDGVENPTLRLVAGREYDLTWTNADGAAHNVAMLDEDGDVVEDYETDLVGDIGERQTLTFTATDEIVEYYCEPHPTNMRGSVDIVDSSTVR